MTKKKSKNTNQQTAISNSPLVSLAESFSALNMNSNSNRKSCRPKRNIVNEFDRYFGEDTKLENWQRLCQDVGIHDVPPSINKCRKSLKGVWVNIYDLIDAVNTNTTPPTRFQNRAALSAYTFDEHKVFPKQEAKEGGPVRALLFISSVEDVVASTLEIRG